MVKKLKAEQVVTKMICLRVKTHAEIVWPRTVDVVGEDGEGSLSDKFFLEQERSSASGGPHCYSIFSIPPKLTGTNTAEHSVVACSTLDLECLPCSI